MVLNTSFYRLTKLKENNTGRETKTASGCAAETRQRHQQRVRPVPSCLILSLSLSHTLQLGHVLDDAGPLDLPTLVGVRRGLREKRRWHPRASL